jgi:hypothetical protein
VGFPAALGPPQNPPSLAAEQLIHNDYLIKNEKKDFGL